MGILGNFLEFWADPGEYYKRREKQSNAAQFGGLLAQQQGAPITLGIPHPDQPQQGPGGLLNQNQSVSPQFYLKAAAIPGYENLAQQAQVGDQSMARQLQSQDWNAQNMTAAQRASADLQQQQLAQQAAQEQARLALQQQQFGQLSAYQQAMLNQNDPTRMSAYQQAQVDLERDKYEKPQRLGLLGTPPPSGYMVNEEGTGYQPIPGTQQSVTQMMDLAALDTGIEAIQRQKEFLKERGSFESGPEAKKLDARTTGELINTLSTLRNSGVLNPSEAEAYKAQIHQFNALSSMAVKDETAQARMEALQEQIMAWKEKVLAAQGRKPPPRPKLPGT